MTLNETPIPPGQGEIVVRTERWPLLEVTFSGTVDGPTFDAYLDDLTRAIRFRAGPRVLLMDATTCGYVSASARKKQADWMRDHDEETRAVTAGIAFVLPSPWLRGALTAILWLQPLNCPHAVAPDVDKGLKRCRAWLDSHGLDIPNGSAPSRR
jgi:hypothetical protein